MQNYDGTLTLKRFEKFYLKNLRKEIIKMFEDIRKMWQHQPQLEGSSSQRRKA
jgi:hypothetical protein